MNLTLLSAPGFDAIRLGWALVHFLWQGLAIALCLEVALLLAGRKNAVSRYALCGLALAVMPLCLIFTYLEIGPQVQVTAAQVSSPTAAIGTAAISPTAPAGFTLLPVVHILTDLTSRRMPSVDVNRWLPGMVACWLAGIIVLSARKAGGFLVLWRLRRAGLQAPSRALRELCRNACARIGVDPRHVELVVSQLVPVPMTMGWLRPVILFPAALLSGLSPREIELLLAHELAHIRRCDYLVNLVQTAVETLFFYHPVTWWIARRMRQERENCCDDLVAARTDEVASYAHALFHLESLRVPGASLAPAASGGSLRQRIGRLADHSAPQTGPGLPLLLTFLSILAVGATSMVKAASLDSASAAGSYAGRLENVAPDQTLYYQDTFHRQGELNGSSPDAVNRGGATWTSTLGPDQYATQGDAATINPAAYAYSVSYLPVNGTSGVTLDGTRDFMVSAVVTPGAAGRAGISLNVGPLGRYTNLFTQEFATLTTSSGFAGAYAFDGGNLGYNYAPGIKGPTTVSLNYHASDSTLTYTVGNTTVHVEKGISPAKVAAIRYVGLGNDGYGGGAATPSPAFANFTFSVATGGGNLAPVAATPLDNHTAF